MQKAEVAPIVLFALNLKNPHRRPGANGGIGIGERPLIGRGLGVRRRVVGAAQDHGLLLSRRRVKDRKGHRVEHQVPLAEVGVFPGIRHRDHIVGMESLPFRVVRCPALRRRGRRGRIAIQPAQDAPAVVLLAPEQARRCAAVDQAILLGEVRDPLREELLPFPLPLHKQSIGLRAKGLLTARLLLSQQAQVHLPLLTGLQGPLQEPRRLGSLLLGIDRRRIGVDQVAMEAIFLIGPHIGLLIEALRVGLVVREEPASLVAAVELIAAEPPAHLGLQHITLQLHRQLMLIGIAPAPGVAQPEGGEEGQGRRLIAAVDDAQANRQIPG